MVTSDFIDSKMNTIMHGDCIDIMKQIPDNYFDLVLTDPPYKFEVHGRGIAQKREYLKEGFKKIGSTIKYDIYNQGFIEECIRICKKPNIFLFCNKAQINDILNKAIKLKLNFEIIIFCKNAPTPLTNNQWLPDKEYGIHLFKNLEVFGDYYTKKSFYVETTFKDTSINHPTAKPLKIVKNIIKNLTKKGNNVFDPFIGSGTTAVVCSDLGLHWFGCEIQEDYIAVANNRLKTVQGSLF